MQAQQWNRLVFGNIKLRKKRVSARLGGIQKQLLGHESVILEQLEGELILEYNDVIEQEELFWWQKSREEQWVDGEYNTQFFMPELLCEENKARCIN